MTVDTDYTANSDRHQHRRSRADADAGDHHRSSLQLGGRGQLDRLNTIGTAHSFHERRRALDAVVHDARDRLHELPRLFLHV